MVVLVFVLTEVCVKRYCSLWIMCIKGFVYRFSHDCYLDIVRDFSTAYCRSRVG